MAATFRACRWEADVSTAWRFAAAAVIVAVRLALGERGATSVGSPTSDYLNSPNYEHRIIEQLNAHRVVASRSSIRAI